MNQTYGLGVECEFPILLDTLQKKNGEPVYMPISDFTSWVLDPTNPECEAQFEQHIIHKLKTFTQQDTYPPDPKLYKDAKRTINNYLKTNCKLIHKKINLLFKIIKKYVPNYKDSPSNYINFVTKVKKISDDITASPLSFLELPINVLLDPQYLSIDASLCTLVSNLNTNLENEYDFMNREWTNRNFFIYEVKNSKIDQTVDQLVQDIEDKRETILNHFKTCLPNLAEHIMIPDFGYYPYLLTENGQIVEDYLGSYHINITLPNMPSLDHFKTTHINLIKALQILEPLFLAVLSCGKYRFINAQCDNFLGVQNVDQFYDDPLYTKKAFKDPKEYPLITQKINKIMGNKITRKGSDFRVNPLFYKPKDDQLFGFEFRFFDLFRIDYLKEIIWFIFMLAEHLTLNNITIDVNPILDIYQSSEYMDPFVGFIIQIYENTNSWQTQVPPFYLDALEQYLGLTDLPRDCDCYDVLNTVFIHIKQQCLTNKDRMLYLPTVDGEWLTYVSNLGDFPNII
jgi:hypothetical protein